MSKHRLAKICKITALLWLFAAIASLYFFGANNRSIAFWSVLISVILSSVFDIIAEIIYRQPTRRTP